MAMNDAPLKPTGKLTPQPWMATVEVKAVFDALQTDGKEARFVGGCVRNAVFGIPVEDIDIATPEPPDRVMKLLAAAGIKAIPTGIDHGTVTAVLGARHYEVTTLRVDVESHGRHATVAYTDDWLADALRRDLTINTLSCTLEGDIYDPLTGMDDLGQRWVRFVGIARERIEEDILRLLRFYRFQATFGGATMDRDALAACRLMAPRLGELSAERIRSELFLILEAPNPADTMILMKGERILEHFLPEAENFCRLRMISWLETTAINLPSVKPDVLRRFAAMLKDDSNGHAELVQRLRLSNKQAKRLALMTCGQYKPDPELSDQAHRQILFELDVELYRDLVLLQWAKEMALQPRSHSQRTQSWIALIEAADSWNRPVFPIRGQDALELGLDHGPEVGKALDAVEEWWRDGDFQKNRNQCLERLKTVIGGPK